MAAASSTARTEARFRVNHFVTFPISAYGVAAMSRDYAHQYAMLLLLFVEEARG